MSTHAHPGAVRQDRCARSAGVLKCTQCRAKSHDIRKEKHAWDGWIVTPKPICPACTAKVVEMHVIMAPGVDGVLQRTYLFEVKP
jgi:hypothetical protein